MPTVVVVHHTVSPTTAAIYDAVVSGLAVEELAEVEVISRPALSASASDVLTADGLLLLSPVNIGYISGALKHFFDQIYYPVLTETIGLRYGAILSGASDASGAVRAIGTITTGLQWQEVAPTMVLTGPLGADETSAIGELAATVGAYAAGLI